MIKHTGNTMYDNLKGYKYVNIEYDIIGKYIIKNILSNMFN